MDQKLSSEIQASIAAIEEQLSQMTDLSILNERLQTANEGLTDGAGALKAAADDLPLALAGFKNLSERLEELAKVLEGSDIAVLVSQVNKIEEDLKPLKNFADQSTDSITTIIGSQISVFEEARKEELEDFKSVIATKLDSVAGELEITSGAIDEAAREAGKQANFIKALLGVAVVLIILVGVASQAS